MRLEMMPNRYKGKLITFCGLDGCGKTTQIHKLRDELEAEGMRVFLTKQPTESVRQSPIFRNFMDTPDHDCYDYRSLSLLCASDRVQHTNRVIAERLAAGDVVISDRYFYSCLANLIARGFDQDRWIYEIAQFIIQPDLAFFLDVSVHTAVERVRRRPEEKDRYIDIPLQYRLRKQYLNIAKENDGVVIDTAESEADCYEVIRLAAKQLALKKAAAAND